MPQASNGEDDNVTWFDILDEEPLDEDVDIDNYEMDQPQVTFEESLEAIQGNAIAPQDLLGFSNITRKQIHQLRATWTTLPEEQRVTIAEVALMVAREHVFADFGLFFATLLGDPAVDVRLNAATGAGLSEVPELIRALTDVAETDENLDVREAALDALSPHVVALDAGLINDRKDLDRLLKLKAWAVDSSWPAALRAAALHAYSHNNLDDDVDGIIESFVQADDDTLQLGAMRAMAVYGAGRFTRFLERQLQSTDIDAREAAAAAMGMSDDPAVVPMLTMIGRTDSEPAVREAAYLALANVGSDAALRSLTQLRENASDDDIDIIDGAIQYITEMNEMFEEIAMLEDEDDL